MTKLFLVLLSVISFAGTACPINLDAPVNMERGRLTISQNLVTWRGQPLPFFEPNYRSMELALLKFLAFRANQTFSRDTLIKRLFPSRMAETPQAREVFFDRLIWQLSQAFTEVDSEFNILKRAGTRGVCWGDPSLASPTVMKVGDVWVTTNEVFWKGLPVPAFGPTAYKKRRFLLSLLDHFNHRVSIRELSAEVWLDGTYLTPFEQVKELEKIFAALHDDFKSVDSEFKELRYTKAQSFGWSVSRQVVKKPPLSVSGVAKRYRFRGVELKLTRSTLALLEILLQHAPSVVHKDDLLSVLSQKGVKAGTTLVSVQIWHLRNEVGVGVIATAHGKGYAWAALDRPELIL